MPPPVTTRSAISGLAFLRVPVPEPLAIHFGCAVLRICRDITDAKKPERSVNGVPFQIGAESLDPQLNTAAIHFHDQSTLKEAYDS